MGSQETVEGIGPYPHSYFQPYYSMKPRKRSSGVYEARLQGYVMYVVQRSHFRFPQNVFGLTGVFFSASRKKIVVAMSSMTNDNEGAKKVICNVQDIQQAAKKLLPLPLYEYIASG